MDIHIQSDGQLYPPRRHEAPKPPPPKPPPPKVIKEERPKGNWEDLMLLAVGFILIADKDKTDIPLLLALAYILFDSCFSLEKLL